MLCFVMGYKVQSKAWVQRRVARAKELGVSEVARKSVGQRRTKEWLKKRENFIKRHLPQYKGTERQKLMFAMWAYKV